MDGSFACPECGYELALKGLSPGRQVRCGWCETWVEVPYLPRSGDSRAWRKRRKAPRGLAWAWRAVAVLAVIVAVLAARRMIKVQGEAGANRLISERTASADADEKAGRFDQAEAAIREAVRQAARVDPPKSKRLESLRQRRAELALRAVKTHLNDAAQIADPKQAVVLCEGLRSRVKKDPELGELMPKIDEHLEKVRRLWAESDLREAHAASDTDPNLAIDRCERLYDTAKDLASAARRTLQDQAEVVVTELVRQRGVVFESARGQFTLGTPRSYDAAFDAELDKAYRQQGYVPRRRKSEWSDVWDRFAPFSVAIQVVERLDGNYLQSRNRLSFIEVKMILNRHGTLFWQEGSMTGHTRPELPSLAAYQASRIAVGNKRNPEAEQLMYDDARASLRDRVGMGLRKIPKYRAPRAAAGG